MLNSEHAILIIVWVLYCFIHSLLAAQSVKKVLSGLLKSNFIYYRISYSIFAFISLAAILIYQFSIESRVLLSFPWKNALAALLMLPGLIMMIITIRKYFYELSGLQAIKKKEVQITLQQNGLHKFIRHPLYSGTLLFVWGLFLFFPLLSHLIACAIITVYTLFGIRLEEKKLIAEYGEQYVEYRKKVPMLIPHFLK